MFKPVTLQNGVNLLQDPKAIDDSEVVRAKNLWPTNSGILSKRPAVDSINNLASFIGIGSRVIGLHLATKTAAMSMLVITRRVAVAPDSTKMCMLDNDYITIASVDTGTITAVKPSVFAYGGFIYAFCGPGCTAPGYKFQVDADPAAGSANATDFAFAGTGNGGVFPQVAVQYRSRFFFANLGLGSENLGLFSDDFDPTIIGNNALNPIDGRSFEIGNRDGDRVVGAVEVMLTAVGSPAQSALLVLREFSAYLITGEPTQSTDAGSKFGDMVINRISFNCGCSSPDSIVTTPYGTIWAGHDDVWIFDHQQVPRRIGSKIRPALANTPPNLRYLWHAAYFNGAYRLAIAGDGQGPDDDSPMQDQWWLDLRGGAPQSHVDAKWWGPQQYLKLPIPPDSVENGSRCMVLDTRPGREYFLYGAMELINVSDSYLVRYDVPGSRDWEGTPWGGIFTSYCEINFELLTKDYAYEDAELDKIHNSTEISIWCSQQNRIGVELNLDGGRQIDLQAIAVPQNGFVLGASSQLGAAPSAAVQTAYATYIAAVTAAAAINDEAAVSAAEQAWFLARQPAPTFDIPASGLAYVTDPSGYQRTGDQFQSLAAFSSPTLRAAGKFHQFRLFDEPGYFVDEARQYLSFSVGATNYTATIPTGLYSTIVTLLDAVVLAMNTAFSNSFVHNFGSLHYADAKAYITITGSSTWRPRWLTGDQPAASVLMGSMLGYDVSTEPAAATAQTASEYVVFRQSAGVQIAAIILKYDVINRRPSP